MNKLGKLIFAILITVIDLIFLMFASLLTIDTTSQNLVTAQTILAILALISIAAVWVRVGHVPSSRKADTVILLLCFAPWFGLILAELLPQ